MAFVVTGIVIAAWIVVAEFFDDRIYTPQDLESALDVDVLATFPKRHVFTLARAPPGGKNG